MSDKKSDRVGETFKTNEGYIITIIKYDKANSVYIEFQDKHKARIHTRYCHCQSGKVKNPYHPSMYGVGCLGLMPDGGKPKTCDKNGSETRDYVLWRNMIKRCYGGYDGQSTYKDVVVCERWLVFANFLEDISFIEGYQYWLEHPNEGVSLDKDIKGNGSKVYCLDSCCFISRSDNTKEVWNSKRINTKRPIYGIHKSTGKRLDFPSQAEAMRSGFIGVNRALKDNSKSSGGYKWYYLEGDEE